MDRTPKQAGIEILFVSSFSVSIKLRPHSSYLICDTTVEDEVSFDKKKMMKCVASCLNAIYKFAGVLHVNMPERSFTDDMLNNMRTEHRRRSLCEELRSL